MAERHHFLVEYMTPRVCLPAGLSWKDEKAHLKTQISTILNSDEFNFEHGPRKNTATDALTNLVRNVDKIHDGHHCSLPPHSNHFDFSIQPQTPPSLQQSTILVLQYALSVRGCKPREIEVICSRLKNLKAATSPCARGLTLVAIRTHDNAMKKNNTRQGAYLISFLLTRL